MDGLAQMAATIASAHVFKQHKVREGGRFAHPLPPSIPPPTHPRQLQDCKLATQTDASRRGYELISQQNV